MLEGQGIPHNVLNAGQHEREAEIIVGAGQPGAVTIAMSNMAGRGVDIKLGEGVRELGGPMCSARSATRRGASTTSSAAVPDAETPASRASTSPRRTTSSASSPATGSTTS